MPVFPQKNRGVGGLSTKVDGRGSPWQQHVQRWRKGCGCALCPKARTRCLARGDVPAEVLLIGEAPGPSEDVLGKPFCGPAGKLLDQMISSAGYNVADHDMLPVRCAFTNLVACFPAGDDGEKFTEPPKEAILACAPRLREFYALCKPSLIVCVGQLAEKWVPKLLNLSMDAGNIVGITHPAAILRANVAQQGLMLQRVVVTLADALDDVRGFNKILKGIK